MPKRNETTTAESDQRLGQDVAKVMAALGLLPAPQRRPALVVVSGLPGSGKSHFSRLLRERWPLVRLESDAIRKLLFGQPTYSAQESKHLFSVIHAALESLLRDGRSVILDATNLREANRRRLYELAERTNARLILIRVTAPAKVIRQRLSAREERRDPLDVSEADIEVYQRMRKGVQAISRPHLVIDTSRDIEPLVQQVVHQLAENEDKK